MSTRLEATPDATATCHMPPRDARCHSRQLVLEIAVAIHAAFEPPLFTRPGVTSPGVTPRVHPPPDVTSPGVTPPPWACKCRLLHTSNEFGLVNKQEKSLDLV